MTRAGTSHFHSLHHAQKYYAVYDVSKWAVQNKLDEGIIHIGKPKLTAAQKEAGVKRKLDVEGRWFIMYPDKFVVKSNKKGAKRQVTIVELPMNNRG